MGPKKNKKRNQQQEDEQFIRKQKYLEQKLKKVQKKQKKQEDEQQEMEVEKSKQIFVYELSKQNEKALKQAQQKQQKKMKEIQKKQIQQNVLSVQQKKELQRKLEKQRVEKQKKQRKKEEKKVERQKIREQEKLKQQQLQEQRAKEDEEVRKLAENPKISNSKFLPLFFLFFILILFFLQYQREIYTRLSKFNLSQAENFYQTFQIDPAATDRQLKEKYKRLVLKYHPDKNPNCQQCEVKFNQIIKAWEVLGSPEKRKHYDDNSGFITQIKSHSLTLTPQNYQDQVQGSKSLWLIQVYDSTQKYCHYFAQFWEEVINQYGEFIRFGRIDVWTQTNMLSYLPYRFQVFPSIYYYHKGQIEVCSFDFQQPDWSIKRCIQNQYRQNIIKSIKNITEIQRDNKPSIIFTQKVKIGSRFKVVNKKYETDFNFYSLQEKNNKSQIIAINSNQEQQVFQVNVKDSTYYKKYQNFLQSLIVQKISICQLITKCQNQPCFVIINQLKDLEIQKFTLPKQNPNQAYPVFLIQDPQFNIALNDLKNKTQFHEKFLLGLYQNGHIDLGYFEDAKLLKSQEGESFQQLHCHRKDRSWIGKIKNVINTIIQFFDRL